MFIKLKSAFRVGVVVTAVLVFRASFHLLTGAKKRYNGAVNIERSLQNERTEHTQKEDKTKEPAMLLILTYARCGSSFLGNIFNNNPQAFYWYEPLDGVYVHLYGTETGVNIASDISHFPNMTRRFFASSFSSRPVPEVEIDGMTATLRQILTCNVDDLWPEVAFHDFWIWFKDLVDQRPFQNCLLEKKISMLNCHPFIVEKCGQLFNPIQRPKRCFNPLAMTPVIREDMLYYICIHQQMPAASSCLKHLGSACTNSSIRSVKAIRANMKVAERLLQELPNLKVLHLMRDPRAVALSRGGLWSHHSQHSYQTDLHTGNRTYDIVREAAIVCDSFLMDVEKSKQLSERFPGRIMEVIYEQFVNSPINATQEIYNFLERNPSHESGNTETIEHVMTEPHEDVMHPLQEWGEITLDKNVVAWLKNNTGQSKDIAVKWKTEKDKTVWESIYTHPLCKSLFEQYAHVWPPL